ncbi:MAG: CGNR zinc finger domain-containing protein [Propionicimonas sp.]|uniref:CGNR zinc finger domain-containing protein n=1 Tax=Propionicimonas sp. TaxID=1955623 RepID=UPI003D0BD85A
MPQRDAELVVDFLNTVDLEAGTDLLDDPGAFAAWCAAHGTVPGDLGFAREVRDVLRRAVTRPVAGDLSMPVVALHATVGPDGVDVAGLDAAGAVLACAGRLTARGEWSRVKLCPGDDCGEAFYDRSRNHSRVWCDMAVCGNVAKVRTSRRRHAAGA